MYTYTIHQKWIWTSHFITKFEIIVYFGDFNLRIFKEDNIVGFRSNSFSLISLGFWRLVSYFYYKCDYINLFPPIIAQMMWVWASSNELPFVHPASISDIFNPILLSCW